MTVSPAPSSSGAVRFAGQWWPIALVFVLAKLASTLVLSGQQARGHAGGHLASAGALFPMVAVFAVIMWTSPRTRRLPAVWVVGVVMTTGLLIQLAGNLRVVHAINGENWSDAQASALGPSRPGFASGHDLAQLGSWVAVLATVALSLILLWRHQIGARVAVGATAVSAVFPHFVVPGAGIIVLAGALCVHRFRRLAAGSVTAGDDRVVTEEERRSVP